MLFPYWTDAPIYYWPVATVVLIAINGVVFVAEMAALSTAGLSPKVQGFRKRLEREAAAAIKNGTLEPAAEDW